MVLSSHGNGTNGTVLTTRSIYYKTNEETKLSVTERRKETKPRNDYTI